MIGGQPMRSHFCVLPRFSHYCQNSVYLASPTGGCTLSSNRRRPTGGLYSVLFSKDEAKMSLKNFMRSTIMAIGIRGVALAGGRPTPGTAAESYPLCTQGSLLH